MAISGIGQNYYQYNVETKRNAKNVNSTELSEAEEMEQFKKEFYAELERIPKNRTIINLAVNISEEAFENMKADPEYRAKIMSVLQRDLTSSFAPLKASLLITVGATEKDYRGDSWSGPNNDSEFFARSQNSFYKKTSGQKDRQKELLKEYLKKRAQEKRQQKELLDERIVKEKQERRSQWQMAKVYEKVQQQANIRKSLWEERAQAKKEWEEVNRPTIIMPILEGRDSEAEVSSRGEMGEGKEKRESENGTHRGEKRQENVDRKPYTIGCEVENLMSHNQARAEYGVVARRVNATKFVVEKKVTDYMAVNSVRVAGMMRGRRFFRKPDKFLSVTARLGSFPRLVGFMLRSMLWYLPGKKVREDIIRFSEPSNVTIHAEGEHQRLNGVREIRVRKAKRGMKVVRF